MISVTRDVQLLNHTDVPSVDYSQFMGLMKKLADLEAAGIAAPESVCNKSPSVIEAFILIQFIASIFS